MYSREFWRSLILCLVSIVLATTLLIVSDKYYELVKENVYLSKYIDNVKSSCLYEEIRYNQSFFVNGLYLSNHSYCVWTQGRSLEEINRTDCHEYCHALIGQDRNMSEHFCGDS